LSKVAGLFLKIAQVGYLIDGDKVSKIMENSGKNWKDDVSKEFSSIADSCVVIAQGNYEMDYSRFIANLIDID